jgi:uncharacterized lipoprotein YddW (UPF0748 family)
LNPLAALLLLAAQAHAAPQEMRGLWVVRTALVSPEAADQAVDQAARAGFNSLFVQVRGRGDAFYASKHVPQGGALAGQPADFDPLRRVLERARAQGLSVHAWINVMLSASFVAPLPAGHVVAQHPDWVMVPRSVALAALKPGAPLLALVRQAAQADPDVEGYYLSPAAPGVGQHLEQVVRELVRGYELDGLHFDFIRYPGKDYDYSASALNAFGARQRSRQPLQLALQSPELYAEHRREVLSALVARLSLAARQERPSLALSAAVVPDEAAALHQKFQDWPRWSARGLIDGLAPMSYSPDERVFRAQVARARELAPARRVWAGVPAYRLTFDEQVQRVSAARALGAQGVVFFSHESLQPGALVRLRREAFGEVIGSQ